MKNYLLLFTIITFITFSCDDYLDINENPNGASSPPITGLLANVTYNSAMNAYRVGYTTSYYTQYNASSSNASPTDTYDKINTNSIWSNIYDMGSNIFDMINAAEEEESNYYVGVGKILMAYNMGTAVDIYGDIPYSAAFDFNSITPVYDNDAAIYADLMKLLDEAIAELKSDNNGRSLSNTSDFIHGGNVNAWIKTAYALKARFLNHLSKTDQYNPTAVLEALSHSYTSNSDDAQLTTFKTRNPWNTVAVNNAGLNLDGWLSEHIANAMNGEIYGVFDPRLPLITDTNKDDLYIGTRNGAGRIGSGTDNEEIFLTLDGFYSSPDSPLFVITYSELKFIEAEAQYRNNDKAGAYSAYLEGIRSHMEKMGVDSAEMNTYLSNPIVAVGEDNIDLKTIFKEKYVAMFLNPESWVDVRRNDYDYKDMMLPVNANLNEFIRRIDYPKSEEERNNANMPKDLKRSDRVFWDIK